jgi:hypothetical protein
LLHQRCLGIIRTSFFGSSVFIDGRHLQFRISVYSFIVFGFSFLVDSHSLKYNNQN